MKRLISLALAILTLFGCISCLSGCSPVSSTLTKGEWLSMLCDGFGMDSYQQQTPYAKTVASDSPYFGCVQTAFEWEIISDTQIDLDALATKGFLAQTLVKCVGIKDISGMSDDEITQYAVDNGYVTF